MCCGVGGRGGRGAGGGEGHVSVPPLLGVTAPINICSSLTGKFSVQWKLKKKKRKNVYNLLPPNGVRGPEGERSI